MPIVADASVAMRGDFSKFSGDLKKAETQTKGLGKRLDAALSPKALVGGLAGGFAALKVVDFLGDAVSAASNLGETMSKVNEIFGEESMPALEEWASAAGEALGISKQAALDAAATFATFGKSAGLAGDDLVGFSTDLTGLAADLGSFYNTSPEDAITAIGAALRGESEPIRQYGVLLDDATLRQRAMTLGITDSIKNALTPQQRVLAAQAEIFAQTSDAQGDFARTSGGLAGQQKILAAKLADINVEIGEKLLPVMVALTTFLVDNLIPAFEAILPVAFKVIEIAFWPMVKAIEGIIAAITFAVDAATDMALNFGDMGTKVHATADEMGVSFEEMKASVKHNMLDMGMSFDEAVEAARHGGSGMADTWAAAWSDVAATTTVGGQIIVGQAATIPGNVAGVLAAGAPEVEAGAEEGLVAPVEAASDLAIEQANNAARAVTGAYAGELAQGSDKVDAGWEALLSGAEDEQTKAQRIAEINAHLTSQELTDALHSEDPYLRAQAIAYRETLETELDTLSTNAIYQAWLTGKSVPEAVRDNKQAAADEAAGMRRRVVKALQMTEQAGQAGEDAGKEYTRRLAAGITTEQWLVTQKVADILAILTGAGSPPFTKFKEGAAGAAKAYLNSLSKGLQDARLSGLMDSLLPSSEKAGIGVGESWGASLGGVLGLVKRDVDRKLKGLLDADFAKIPRGQRGNATDDVKRVLGGGRCEGCDQGCKPMDCARLGKVIGDTEDAIGKSNKIVSDHIRKADRRFQSILEPKGKGLDKDFFKEVSNGFYNSIVSMTSEMAKQLPAALLKQFAEHNITVNVVDGGVARSVGDIGRGLRELGSTGQLP